MLLYQLKDETNNKRFAETIIDLHAIIKMQGIKDNDGYNICFEFTNTKAFALYSSEESVRAAMAEIFKLLESDLDASKIAIKDVIKESEKSDKIKDLMRHLVND